MFNPNYQPIPNLSLPTYHLSDWNMSKGDYVYYQTHNLPKKTLPGGGGNQLRWLNRTPNTDWNTKARTQKKTTQPFLVNNWRKIWIRIWLKKFQFNKWQNGIKKIIPFKNEGKINNERFI